MQETDYQTGERIAHTRVCFQCAQAIEARNEVYYRLMTYFANCPGKLTQLRGEHAMNERETQ